MLAAGDVSVEADARRMIGAAVDRFGRLDVLVANAGIIPLGVDVTEIATADWDNVMAIDGRGMFLTCKFAIEAMWCRPARGAGRLLRPRSPVGCHDRNGSAAYGPASLWPPG